MEVKMVRIEGMLLHPVRHKELIREIRVALGTAKSAVETTAEEFIKALLDPVYRDDMLEGEDEC